MGRPLDEDMVINVIKNGDYYMTWVDRAMLIEEIKDLPSAERKKGHWEIQTYEIPIMPGYSRELSNCVCSECGSEYSEISNYCPNCGADMELSEPKIEQCCDNCKWYRSMDDYCVSYSCNIDGREKHSCFEEE